MGTLAKRTLSLALGAGRHARYGRCSNILPAVYPVYLAGYVIRPVSCQEEYQVCHFFWLCQPADGALVQHVFLTSSLVFLWPSVLIKPGATTLQLML